MTICELLGAFDDIQFIKIGAREGTGFFYCGQAAEYKRQERSYSYYLRKAAGKRMQQADAEIAMIQKWTKATPERILNTHRRLSDAIESYTRFKHLWKRRVLDSFEADALADEKQPIVILVEGDEYGTFWTCQDAKNLGEPFSIGWRAEITKMEATE